VAEDFQCVICRSVVEKGYRVEGSFYCPAHVDTAFPHCSNCEQVIRGSYVAVGSEKVPVCLSCRNEMQRCFVCTLPADLERGGADLGDGRFICAVDRKSAVTHQQQASRLFQQAGAEIQDTFYGALRLKKPVGSVTLVDLHGLQAASKQSAHRGGVSQGRVLGVTTVTFVRRGNERWLEPVSIHLLNHVPSDRMVSVSAHEYAHVWQAENHRDYGSTQSVLREGFAEWVAYKVSENYRRERILRIMRTPSTSVYYRGLMKFLELERQRGVDAVLNYAVNASTI